MELRDYTSMFTTNLKMWNHAQTSQTVGGQSSIYQTQSMNSNI